MGMFLPCLLAAILNACAMQMFREPMKIGNGPLMAVYMFIFTMFIMLWSVRLYPRNLRKVGKLQFIIEFLTAEFLMEDLIIDFWFPLEKSVLDGLQTLAQSIEEWVSAADTDWSAEVITDFLKNESCGFYASYAMALFFLLATLHASRVIDLRTLTQDGPRCFFKEIHRKIKMGIRRILRKFGIGKRKVKINELRNTHQSATPCGRTLMPSKCLKKKQCSESHCLNEQRSKNGCQHDPFCPIHNPCTTDDSDDESEIIDFEDLGKISDLDCE